MSRDLALKLRLTHLVTGCVTQKELHARFKQVNPSTGYEPERAYKWLGGYAAPRDLSVYEDLARVLDLPVTGETVRTCAFDEFRRLVEARHGPVPAVTAAEPAARGRVEPSPGPAAGPILPRYLPGRYLAVSMAWSAARSGSLILGSLEIAEEVPGRATALYEERLPGGDMVLEGGLQRLGRSLLTTVSSPADEMYIFFCFPLPPSPALALAGTMAGVAYHDAETRPIAGRVFCIRTGIATREEMLPLTGYIESREDAVAAALRAVGLDDAQAGTIAGRILGFVTAPPTGRGLIEVQTATVNAAVAPLYEAVS